MSIPLPVNGQKEVTVCRLLRTKTAFGSFEGAPHDWHSGDSTTAVYWCLATMETAGPDDQLAHPHQCQQQRCCFHPALQ